VGQLFPRKLDRSLFHVGIEILGLFDLMKIMLYHNLFVLPSLLCCLILNHLEKLVLRKHNNRFFYSILFNWKFISQFYEK
jgi:hypothetical protein